MREDMDDFLSKMLGISPKEKKPLREQLAGYKLHLERQLALVNRVLELLEDERTSEFAALIEKVGERERS